MTASCRFPVVVALPGVMGCDAIGKVFERFSAGSEESLAALYEIVIAPQHGKQDSPKDAGASSQDKRNSR